MAGQVFFYFLAAVTSAGAVAVVALPNPLYSVLSLILTFIGLAGLYLTLNAQFIAVVQVIIYAGAIMVLFLFVVMLLNLGREERGILELPVQKLLGVIAGLAVFTILVKAAAAGAVLTGAKGLFPPERVAELGNIQILGKLLFTKYLLPFQAMGVLLFVGIIGAVVLARRRTR
ncbi:MAG: NADH-quinone oxidoreductase subunit J [bacterium]